MIFTPILHVSYIFEIFQISSFMKNNQNSTFSLFPISSLIDTTKKITERYSFEGDMNKLRWRHKTAIVACYFREKYCR